MSRSLMLVVLAIVTLLSMAFIRAEGDEKQAVTLPVVTPTVICRNPTKGDQDDLAFWQHPQHPEQSLVLASDKKGNQILSYDLAGKLVQVLPVGKPGNIDVRQQVELNGQRLDLVVWNQREPEFRIRVSKVNPSTRQLEFIDAGGIPTEGNYGGTLYHSRKTGKLFFLCTSKGPAEVAQYELSLSDKSIVTGKKVRGWDFKQCEGAVADEEQGVFFLAEEDHGVWKIPAEPTDVTPMQSILKIGEHGLVPDLEGMTLAKGAKETGWLIISSQGSNSFRVFDRQAPHRFIGAFSIAGATESDGIDLFPNGLGPTFPAGVFGCHTDSDGHPILLTRWDDILKALKTNASPSN